MKKQFVTLLVILGAMIPSFVSAQNYTSPVKKIYKDLSGQPAVSTVFLTSGTLKMSLSLIGGNMEQAQRDSLRNLINSMNEIIVLGNLSPATFNAQKVKALKEELEKADYQMMVEVREGVESLNVYMLEDPKKHTIKDLVAIINENGGGTLLSITGDMTPQQLASVAAYANIDISQFLNVQ